MKIIILSFLLLTPIFILGTAFILEMKFRKKYGFFPFTRS